MVGLDLDSDDPLVGVVGDDEEDLSRHLVDIEFLDERPPVIDPGQLFCRGACDALEISSGDAHVSLTPLFLEAERARFDRAGIQPPCAASAPCSVSTPVSRHNNRSLEYL